MSSYFSLRDNLSIRFLLQIPCFLTHVAELLTVQETLTRSTLVAKLNMAENQQMIPIIIMNSDKMLQHKHLLSTEIRYHPR